MIHKKYVGTDRAAKANSGSTAALSSDNLSPAWFVLAGAHGPQYAAGVVAAAHGHFAAAADFENAAFVFAQHLDQAFDLAFDAGHLDHQRLRGEIDDAGAEDLDQIEDLRRGSAAWRPP